MAASFPARPETKCTWLRGSLPCLERKASYLKLRARDAGEVLVACGVRFGSAPRISSNTELSGNTGIVCGSDRDAAAAGKSHIRIRTWLCSLECLFDGSGAENIGQPLECGCTVRTAVGRMNGQQLLFAYKPAARYRRIGRICASAGIPVQS